MKLTLAVLCYRRYDLLQKLLETAVQGTRRPDKFWIVDTGGGLQKAVEDGVLKLTDGKVDGIETVVEAPGNLGIATIWNRVLDASEDNVVFANDDVELDPHALEHLAGAAETQEGDFFYPFPNATMFCLFLIKKSCFQKIGRFDEKFWPCYFEDNDYHRRMKLGGAIEVRVPDVKYLHVGSATLKSFSETEKKEHDARFAKNRDYYVRKWGGLPGHETKTTPGA